MRSCSQFPGIAVLLELRYDAIGDGVSLVLRQTFPHQGEGDGVPQQVTTLSAYQVAYRIVATIGRRK
jgi:hypothetical protein